jgi:hypothetical protein
LGSTLNAIGIRFEGVTEQLQQFAIYGGGTAGGPFGTNCSGTTNTTTLSVSVSSNAPFTNVLLTGTTTNATDAIAYIQYTPSGGVATNASVAGTLSGTSTMTFSFTVPTGATVNGISLGNLRVNASS